MTYSNSHANDKQEFILAIESVPVELSVEISTAVADTGYFSANNIVGCEQMEIEPIISTAREKHNRLNQHKAYPSNAMAPRLKAFT